METGSGKTASSWMDAGWREPEPLDADAQVDVCIVGAGIAGMSTAYRLAREGRRVLVLDDGPIGGGETSRTTAHLSNAIDDRYCQIERYHGEEGARLAAESHTAAIDCIERTAVDEGIDCDFRRVDGFLCAPPGQSAAVLERELPAARRAGLEGVERLDRAPTAPPSFETGPCLRFPRQGQFHPMKYLHGLADAITRRGGRLHGGTAAHKVEGGRRTQVHTKDGPTVTAEAVVVATNSPFVDHVKMHSKQAPYRTFAVAGRVPRGALEPALYWDTLEAYHYVRLQPGTGEEAHDLLIVGGEDHKTGQARDGDTRLLRLETWMLERFPMVREVAFRWSGQVMETMDGLAFIGRNPGSEGNVYIATGDSGMGMTHGTIAGMLLTDLIAGRDNPWASLYEPARKPLKAAGQWLRENVNVAAQYMDYVSGGDVSSEDQVPRGGGAVMRHGHSKLAIYRDDEGRLHRFSAVCPHLQCVLAWNPTEHTWDCPCHGSRFSALGQLLNAPAHGPLKEQDGQS